MRSLKFLSIVAGAIIVAAIALLVTLYSAQRQEHQAALEGRMNSAIATRAEVLGGWVNGNLRLGATLGDAPAIRVISAEMSAADANARLSSDLASQMPFVQRLVDEFATTNELSGVYLINPTGNAVLASATAPLLNDGQRQAARKSILEATAITLPLHREGERLIAEHLVPVLAPQTNPATGVQVVTGALLIRVDATDRIASILARQSLEQPGQFTYFVQQADDTGLGQQFEILAANGDAASRQLITTQNSGSQASLYTDSEVYRVNGPVEGTPWILAHEFDADLADTSLDRYLYTGIGLTALLAALTIFGVVALWQRQKSEGAKALADQYRHLAGQIREQQHLLDSVNNSVPQLIGVKDLDGRYTYANPAFCEGVSRTSDMVIGRTDQDIFGRTVSVRLSVLDKKVLSTGLAHAEELQVTLRDDERILNITRVPLKTGPRETAGIVTIASDMTEIRAMHAARDRLREQTLSVLVSTIERSDPHLAGHSFHLAAIAVGIGRHLDLSDHEIDALEQAAMMSQIGKFFIPPEILTKKTRLNDDEIRTMREHISYTLDIVKRIELPASANAALAHMYERLDGSGYPASLSGDEISIHGSILGVADVFVARLSPRAYRSPISADECLDILTAHPGRYEAVVVEALSAFVASDAGETALGQLAETQD